MSWPFVSKTWSCETSAAGNDQVTADRAAPLDESPCATRKSWSWTTSKLIRNPLPPVNGKAPGPSAPKFTSDVSEPASPDAEVTAVGSLPMQCAFGGLL